MHYSLEIFWRSAALVYKYLTYTCIHIYIYTNKVKLVKGKAAPTVNNNDDEYNARARGYCPRGHNSSAAPKPTIVPRRATSLNFSIDDDCDSFLVNKLYISEERRESQVLQQRGRAITMTTWPVLLSVDAAHILVSHTITHTIAHTLTPYICI